MQISSRTPLVVTAAIAAGLVLSVGCGPRKKANTAGVNTTATTPATTVATTTATQTATATATTTAPTTTGTPTATAPTTVGTGPFGLPPVDPNAVADVLAKAAAAMGMPTAAGGVGTPPGDPLAAKIAANAAKYAPGFTAASAIGRAKLKTGEHAGMNFDMEQGKCYVVLGAGGPGVTQVGLFVLFPAAPPNAVMAQDNAHGAEPVIGDGKPLCPPLKASVRIDTSPLAGTGDVAVQVWSK